MSLVTFGELTGVTLDTNRKPVLQSGIKVLVDTSNDIVAGTALTITGNNSAVAASILRAHTCSASSSIRLVDSAATFTAAYEGKVIQKTQGGGKAQAIVLRFESTTELLLDRELDFTGGDSYSVFANTLATPRDDVNSICIGVIDRDVEDGASNTAVDAQYIFEGQLRAKAVTDYNPNKSGGAGLELAYVSDALASVQGLQFDVRKYLL